ncbi:MAG: allantoinase AllB [Thaumarchaeota archaeon]|nr:MAG: allantoinase AllB [Nitrososphaerota archaeon]
MTVDLVVRGCRIVTSTATLEGFGIACDEGKIVQISTDSTLPAADEVIDAKGNFVLPGIVDTHVHMRDPGDTVYKEDWTTGSAGAACGGVTTVFDMPSALDTAYEVRDISTFRRKEEAARSQSVVDFALYGLIKEDNLDDLVKMVGVGAVGFKVFFSASAPGAPPITDGAAVDAFSRIAKTGRRIAVHAENARMIERNERAFKTMGRGDVMVHLEIRNNLSEAEAIQRAILFAEATGAKIHIAHMSSGSGVDAVAAAKSRGLPVSAETCPHYLLLSSDDYKRIGSVIRVNPPVRHKTDSERLWLGILDGTVDCIGTDHAPHSREEKVTDDYWKTLSGFPGLETSARLMLTQINSGRLSLNQYVKLSSENAARLFGIYPQKGALTVGADCDLTIVDMKHEGVIKAEELQSKSKVTPFDGVRYRGKPVCTIVRGNVVMEDGEIVSKPVGQLVKPAS